MYKYVFSLILLIQMVSAEFYVGFMWGLLSRFGYVVGYNFDNFNRVEFHMGSGPNFGWGVAYKKSSSDKPQNYFLFGYSQVGGINMRTGEKESPYYGIVLGYGHNYVSQTGSWSYPLEFAIGPSYNFDKQEWFPLTSVGIGTYWNIK